MKNKHKKKINRILHRAHTKLLTKNLGSKQSADKLRCAAADLRIKHGLCPHSDEDKIYRSQEEVDADKTPNAICPECGLPRLRVAVLLDAAENEPRNLLKMAELVAIDLLK